MRDLMTRRDNHGNSRPDYREVLEMFGQRRLNGKGRENSVTNDSSDSDTTGKTAPQSHEDKELESLRAACEEGHLLAIYQAGHWCDQNRITPPVWLYEAHKRLADMLLEGGLPKGKGRSHGAFGEFRQDTINLARFYMVEDMKRHQEEQWDEHEETLQRTDLSESDRETLIRNAPRNFGKTVSEYFGHTSEELRGTAAQGSPDAIRSSYYKVAKDMKDPVASLKYKLMSDHVLRRAGLEELTPSAMTRKVLRK